MSSLALAFVPIFSLCFFVVAGTVDLLSVCVGVPVSFVNFGVLVEASLVVAASTVFGAYPVSPSAPPATPLVGVTGVPVAPISPGVPSSHVSGSMPAL